jgi:ribosomal protein L7/L12
MKVIFTKSEAENELKQFLNGGGSGPEVTAVIVEDTPVPAWPDSFVPTIETNRVFTKDLIVAIKNKQKLMAIKAVRELTGMGLKEAKDIIDTLNTLNIFPH